MPVQARVGGYAIFFRKAAVEIAFEGSRYLVVPQAAILTLVREEDENDPGLLLRVTPRRRPKPPRERAVSLDRYRAIIPDWTAFAEAAQAARAPGLPGARRAHLPRAAPRAAGGAGVPTPADGGSARLPSRGGRPAPRVVQPGALAGAPLRPAGVHRGGGARPGAPPGRADPGPLLRARREDHPRRRPHAGPGLPGGRGRERRQDPGLLGNTYRLGHTNVLVVEADGRDLPEEACFDRVLCGRALLRGGNAPPPQGASAQPVAPLPRVRGEDAGRAPAQGDPRHAAGGQRSCT
ncbi:MAG: hypothetical protein MZV70_08165 [Desulfobacterales bacterium]|nr:hypothetical protein [Desulfobacterales bacterium]